MKKRLRDIARVLPGADWRPAEHCTPERARASVVPVLYSIRKERAGSTRPARHAGTMLAIPAESVSVTAVPTRTAGSYAEVAKRSDAITRRTASAATIPALTPRTTTRRPEPTIRRAMLELDAPSATRTPNSCALCFDLTTGSLTWLAGDNLGGGEFFPTPAPDSNKPYVSGLNGFYALRLQAGASLIATLG
jgi:hypothetical protein